MIARLAEMERDLIVERTHAGLARAKATGTTLGRTAKTSPADRKQIRLRLKRGDTEARLPEIMESAEAS